MNSVEKWINDMSQGEIDLNNLTGGFIYVLINKENGKIYVGKTVNFINRMQHYKYKAIKEQPKLHAAVTKHGWSNFKLEIIENNILDEIELNKKEIYWIKHLLTFEGDGL